MTNLRLAKEVSELFRKCSTNRKSVEQLEWVCRTCITDIRKGQVPRISVANKVSFPNKPDVLNLYDLEERLLSPRIPFMQIRELPTGGQFSIKGSVVNVPVDVMPTVTALPRQLTSMHTIPVKLKKRLAFSSSVYTENIRPAAVIQALKWLMVNGPVFSQLQIAFDEHWNTDFDSNISLQPENRSYCENSSGDFDQSERDRSFQ